MNIGDELRVSQKRAQSVGEELANTISHGIGLCAALIGAPILLLEAHRSGAGFFFGTVIFAVTMSMLYLGSTLYHAWPQTRGKSILQVLDQSAIFLLIAGNIYPIYARPASRLLERDNTRTCLGTRDFRRDLEGDLRTLASFQTRDDSLSWHGVVGAYRHSADHVGDSTHHAVLAGSRWRRLHHRRTLFREPTSPL